MYPMQSFFPGDHGARVIPVPIPNTEVKTRSGDGTASLGGGRVARCQDFFTGPGLRKQTGFFFLSGLPAGAARPPPCGESRLGLCKRSTIRQELLGAVAPTAARTFGCAPHRVAARQAYNGFFRSGGRFFIRGLPINSAKQTGFAVCDHTPAMMIDVFHFVNALAFFAKPARTEWIPTDPDRFVAAFGQVREDALTVHAIGNPASQQGNAAKNEKHNTARTDAHCLISSNTLHP